VIHQRKNSVGVDIFWLARNSRCSKASLQTNRAEQRVAIGLIGRNAPVTKGCDKSRRRHTMDLTA